MAEVSCGDTHRHEHDMKRIAVTEMIKLSPKKASFVVEYMKDFSPRRAAEASGYSPDRGYEIMKEDEVSHAIESIIQKRLEANLIDADWLLGEMVDNHLIARQQGNITASNTALNMVGKHKRVDAFAADKIKVSTDSDVMDRLNAARTRMKELKEDDDGVSFM